MERPCTCENLPEPGQAFLPRKHCRKCYQWHFDHPAENGVKTVIQRPCRFLDKPTTEPDEFSCLHPEHGKTKDPCCRGIGKSECSHYTPMPLGTRLLAGEWKDAGPNTSLIEMVHLLRTAGAFPDGPMRQAWAGWENTRLAHIELMYDAIRNPPPYPGFEGRGIVSCVSAKPGNSSGKELANGYLPGAFVMVKELRRLGCTLPVTFAHMGPLEFDWNLAKILEPYGVNVIDLNEKTAADPWRILAGFESKIAAAYYAPYKDVLFIDADNVPVKDPMYLFESHHYRHYGAVFWPDLPPFDRAEWLPAVIWKNIDMDFLDVQAAESGQFMINKEKCWTELNLVRWMNEHSDWFYRFIFGDKDSFVLAWQKVADMVRKRELAWPIEKPTSYGMPSKPAGWYSRAILQHDFSGDLLFQHACRDKPSLHGYGAHGYLVNEDHCNKHLEELRGIWNGKLWDQSDPTPEQQRLIDTIVGRDFIYERKGLGERPMRFWQDGAIGKGRERCEASWSIWEKNGRKIMIICDVDSKPTMLLREQADGGYAGKWLEFERCEVEIRPA